MSSSNISKRDFQSHVHHRLKKIFNKHHILSVINILFEELVKDLRSGKKIKIANFGTLNLKKMPPRHYYDVRFQRVMTSPGHYIVRFFMARPIKKILCQSIDLDKQKEGT